MSLGVPLTVRLIRDFVGNAALAASRVAFFVYVPMDLLQVSVETTR
jgi:hypothetical protein